MARTKQQRTGARFYLAAIPAALAMATSVDALEAVGRYSTIHLAPTTAQRDLLAAPVSVHFSDEVTTVGEAVDVVLRGTGYALSSTESADSERVRLLALPLPAVHRDLAVGTIRRALTVLAGPAFKLVEDPVHRLVSFERCRETAEPPPEIPPQP